MTGNACRCHSRTYSRIRSMSAMPQFSFSPRMRLSRQAFRSPCTLGSVRRIISEGDNVVETVETVENVEPWHSTVSTTPGKKLVCGTKGKSPLGRGFTHSYFVPDGWSE